MKFLDGYRTYIFGLAIILQGFLQSQDITLFDSKQIEGALTVVLGIGVLVFRKLAKGKVDD